MATTKKPRRKAKKRKVRLAGEVTGNLNGFDVMRVAVTDLRGAAADYNPRDIDDEALGGLKASTSSFGLVQPIVWNKRTGRIVGGHQRLKTLGEDEQTDVVVVDLDETREKTLNLALNNENIQGHWTQALGALLEEIQVEVPDLATGLRLDDLLDSVVLMDPEDVDDSGGLSDNYSRKIASPVYEPKGEKPSEEDLYDRTKSDALLAEIDAVEDLPDEVMTFLVNAAERHTVFKFDRIAEYYAHAPAEVQDLMERSALVIVDFERAIELGYVRLTEAMLEQAGVAKAADEEEAGDA